MNEYTVCSGSMRFALREGDLIRVRADALETVRTGDVVLLISDVKEDAELPHLRLMAHRFLWKQKTPGGDLLWTMGDANGFALDRPSPAGAFAGRVVAVDRGDGRWRDPDGGAGTLGRLARVAGSSAFFGLVSAALSGLKAAYGRCARFPRLKPVRRVLVEAAAVLEAL